MPTWTQLPQETARAYRAFKAYRDMGADRSFDQAYAVTYNRQLQDGKRSPGFFRKWANIYEWSKRVAEYDAHLAELAEQARERELREDARLFVQERRERRRKLMRILDKLYDQGDRLVSMPVVRVEQPTADGQPVVIMPVGAKTLHDVAGIMKIADQLDRGLVEEAQYEETAPATQAGPQIIRVSFESDYQAKEEDHGDTAKPADHVAGTD